MAIPLEPVRLGESSPIRVRFSLGPSPRAGGWKILVVKYDGICRSGDDGAADGRFMLAMGQAGLTAWEPDGLVIDLTDLDCRELVDGLTSLLSLGEGYFGNVNLPQAVVVGPRSEEAIGPYFVAINVGCRVEATQKWYYDVPSAIDDTEEEMTESYSIFGGKGRLPESR